jgi:hypothetical protein
MQNAHDFSLEFQPAPQTPALDHSPTFVTRTLLSGNPRTGDSVQPRSRVQTGSADAVSVLAGKANSRDFAQARDPYQSAESAFLGIP